MNKKKVNDKLYLSSMGDLQDPKMEVRKRTILLAIFCGHILLHRPYIW